MTTKRKVITNFASYKDAELYLISQTSLDGLTANATIFPSIASLPPLTQPPAPAAPIPNITDASADYFTKLKKSRSRDVEDVNAKNEARLILEGMLNAWANYVNLVAKGNLSMLLTSGFDLNSERQKAGILPAPTIIDASSPGVGQLSAKVEPIDNASSINWMINEADATGVPVGANISVSTSGNKLFMANDSRIVSSKRYVIKCVAIGADQSALNWSDPVYVTIQ